MTMTLPDVVHDVDRWLREGKQEVGWRGDPRLWLDIGVIKTHQHGIDPKTGRYQRAGDVIGWQWQVKRHTELGKEEIILRLKGEDLYRIFEKLIAIDPRTPGHEDTMDVVEREDALLQKHRQQAIAEAHGENMEHLWALVADRQNGRTTFRGMPGSNPDRQM